MPAGNSSSDRLGAGSSSLVAGVDMAASKPPALCVARGRTIEYVGYVDLRVIPTLLSGLGVKVVAIDSPFSLPSKVWRKVDLVGKKVGFKLLPPSWKGMRKMVTLNLELLSMLSKYGIHTIETFPGGLDFKCTYKYLDHRYYENKDFMDSCIAAAVSRAYLEGEVYSIWAEDGEIVLSSTCFKRGKAPRFGPSSYLRVSERLLNQLLRRSSSHRRGKGDEGEE